MSKISDELRDYCKKVLCYTHYYDKFWHLADRIDSEMVELPKDKDGRPIHVGDSVFVFRSGDALFVSGILMKAGCVCVRVNHAGKADDWYTTPGAITIKRPDSFERIADELDEQAGSLTKDGYAWQEDAIHGFADRIRKLAQKED